MIITDRELVREIDQLYYDLKHHDLTPMMLDFKTLLCDFITEHKLDTSKHMFACLPEDVGSGDMKLKDEEKTMQEDFCKTIFGAKQIFEICRSKYGGMTAISEIPKDTIRPKANSNGIVQVINGMIVAEWTKDEIVLVR